MRSLLVVVALLAYLSPLAAAPQPAENDPRHPAAALPLFTTADDLQIEQLLAEPTIAQPVFLDFDERGRMWVVEYRQYPSPAGIKLVSKDSFWRAVYDNVPPPPPHHVPGLDRITIHEDTNGDGSFDRHRTFVEGLNIATSVVHGRGGVWVLNPPYLLFYPDANRDDVPDSDPVVHLAGFGLEDTHAVANSLRWGPDGWLYAAQGSTVTARIARPGVDEEPVYSQGQNIWRYHPGTRRYEVFAEGGGNAFGVEIDAKGRLFSGHNGGNTRGFHYAQGAYLLKGFNKHGPLSNPHAYGYFPHMNHHNVERFTHNFILYEAGALPEHYLGKLFGIEPLQGRVVLSSITPDQSTFKTVDVAHPVTTTDAWFRPVDIKAGPDGAIYLCDWYDEQVNHFRNHEGKIDPASGRVYRLRARNAQAWQPTDLGALSSTALLEVLVHPNKWQRQTALRLIADRRDRSLIPHLLRRLETATGQTALEMFWALNLSGGFTEHVALETVNHADPFVRLWTVRLLADQRRVSPDIRQKFVELAESEVNVEVRAQLASSAKRLPAADCLSIVAALLAREEDADDQRMPLLLWWALESKATTDRSAVLALFEDSPFWERRLVKDQILERIARRYAQDGTRRNLLACARLFELAPTSAHATILLKGFESAFQGRSIAALPDELVRVLARYGNSSMTLKIRQGDFQAVAIALEAITNRQHEASERIQFIQLFGEVDVPESVAPLLEALRANPDAPTQSAILGALQRYELPRIGEVVAGAYEALTEESLPAAQTLLVSRAVWAREFLDGVKAGRIDGRQVPLGMVQRIQLLGDDALTREAAEMWGAVSGPPSAEMERTIGRIAGVIDQGEGNPYNGRALFQNACAVCHILFSDGGQIGPDLTVYNRSDVAGMLLSIVNPSAEIREGYENVLVQTDDGRALTGFLVEEDSRLLVLRGLDGRNVTIERSAIAELTPAGMSLMPEGLLESMTDRQLRDLFAYLRSTQPLVGEPPRP